MSTGETTADLSFHDVTLVMDGRQVLRGINLHVPAGRITALLGPRCAGKSTLLSAVNHTLRRPFRGAGSIRLQGSEIAPWSAVGRRLNPSLLRRRIAHLPQGVRPFPGSVFDNVAFPLRGRERRSASRQVEETLLRIGVWNELRDRIDRPVPDDPLLARCVCLARAIVHGPEVLLVDDPTWDLDWPDTLFFESALRRLTGMMTVLAAVRRPAQAGRIAGRIAFLKDGRLIEDGAAETLWRSPVHPETEAFLNGDSIEAGHRGKDGRLKEHGRRGGVLHG